MSTPRHHRPTFCEPARGRSTEDTPIYDQLLREFADAGKLTPGRRQQGGIKWATPTEELLRRVLAGLHGGTRDRPVVLSAQPQDTVDWQLPTDAPAGRPALPRRRPGAQLPPGARPRRSGTRGVPPVLEVRHGGREPFTWLPAQVG